MRPPVLIEPTVFDERIAALTAHGGDHLAAGLTLEDIGDMIFTRMKHVSPQIYTEAKEPKAKAPSKKTVGVAKLDDLLG